MLVLASDQPDWRIPLAALLRQRGVAVCEAEDIFGAMSEVDAETRGIAFHLSLGAAEVVFAARAARKRHGDDLTLVLVGHGDGDSFESALGGADFDHAFDNPFAYVALADALTQAAAMERAQTAGAAAAPGAATQPRPTGEHRAVPPAAAASEAPGPRAARAQPYATQPIAAPPKAVRPVAPVITDSAALDRWLRVARADSYFDLLQVPRDATRRELDTARDRLVARLRPPSLTETLADARAHDVRELLAAIDDAWAVLSTPQAREWYVAGLD